MNRRREEWLQARQALKDEANQARSEAADSRRRPDGTLGPTSGISADIPLEEKSKPVVGGIGKGAQVTAAAAHVSPAVAARAEAIYELEFVFANASVPPCARGGRLNIVADRQ
jgi:hypothetical protein